MKKNSYKAILALFMAVSALSRPVSVKAQPPKEISELKTLSALQLKEKLVAFKKDPGFQALYNEAAGKGFGQITDQPGAAYSWGFTGKWVENNVSSDVVICGYDFANQKGQTCTMLWGKVGSKIYKTYMVFPDSRNGLDALGNAQEWYTDTNNRIQLAHSLKSCLRNWINDECTGWCKDSNKDCLAAATTTRTVEITVGFVKYTTTTSQFSLSRFVSCVAAGCISCIALGLASCALSN